MAMAIAIIPRFLAPPPAILLPLPIDSHHTFAFLLLHLTIAAIFLASTKLSSKSSKSSSAPTPAHHSTSLSLRLPVASAGAGGNLQQHRSELPTDDDASDQDASAEIGLRDSSSSSFAADDSCHEFSVDSAYSVSVTAGGCTVPKLNTPLARNLTILRSSEITVCDQELDCDCCPSASFTGSTVTKLASVDYAPFQHEIDRRAEEFIRGFYQRCMDADGDK